MFALGVVGGGREPEDDAHLGEVVLHQHARGEVGVLRQDGDIARAQQRAEDGGAGGHAGGEDQRGGAIAVAGVGVAGGEWPDSIWPMAFSSAVQVGLCERA